jgi:hypothetical protein
MKMVAEYVEHALQFERLAAHESDVKLKADFEKQAAAYRKLAADRAEKLGMDHMPDTKPT